MTLGDALSVKVGYSDHVGREVAAATVALGASALENTSHSIATCQVPIIRRVQIGKFTAYVAAVRNVERMGVRQDSTAMRRTGTKTGQKVNRCIRPIRAGETLLTTSRRNDRAQGYPL